MELTYTVVPITPDTPEWEEERRNSIGASDVPNLLSVPGAYGTPLEVYRSKLGVDEPFPPLLGFIGHQMEAVMENWLRTFHPEIGQIEPGFMARSIEHPRIHASFDRMVDGVPIQMKSVHLFAADMWMDGVPPHVEAQVQTEMFVAGTDHAWVVAFIGGSQFQLERLERDDDFIENVAVPGALEMWSRVEDRRPPDVMVLSDVRKRWPVDDGSVLDVSDPELGLRVLDLWELWIDWERERREIDETIAGAKLELQKAMGSAEVLAVGGRALFTFKSNRAGQRVFRRVKGDK